MMMQSTADINIISSMNPEIEPARPAINVAEGSVIEQIKLTQCYNNNSM